MKRTNSLNSVKEMVLNAGIQEATVETKSHFNFNKLQAVLCMALSAIASISLIAWAVTSFGG